MAKCPICKARKGKRRCLIADEFICSLCCGTTRNEEKCTGCSYYQKPKRNYRDAPSYTPADMEANINLSDVSDSIEGAICAFDLKNDKALKDDMAIGMIELLIDKYHFGDEKFDSDDPFILQGAEYLDKTIEKDLKRIDKDTLVKVLGVIRFVAKRRTRTGREYMSVIHQYVGTRVGTGARLLRM